jgi:hypothetical protein
MHGVFIVEIKLKYEYQIITLLLGASCKMFAFL